MIKAILLCLAFLFASHSTANELLPVQKAFQLTAKFVDNQVIFSWNIAKGYYLYKDKFQISTDSDIDIGKLIYPKAIIQTDEFFGRVAVYRHQVDIIAPIKTLKNNALSFVVAYQGCADVGVCYPPISKAIIVKASQLTQVSPVNQVGTFMSSLGKKLFQQISPAQNQHPLPPKQAFKVTVSQDENDIIAQFDVMPNYYLYKNKFKFYHDGQAISPKLPIGKIKQDELFGRVEVYEKSLSILLPIYTQTGSANIEIHYQGCWSGGVCYPPQRYQKTINITPKISNNPNNKPIQTQLLSEEQNITQLLQKESFWWSLLLFFGFGVLLSLTPCVFPMIPILSGILIGQKNQSMLNGFVISVVFVVSMALVYAIAGAIAGYSGANLQSALQTPVVLIAFSAVFILLAFSMFGFYDIALPQRLQNKLNTLSGNRNGLIGSAIMGSLSALIVGPCVAPPLAGALIYIGQTGDTLLGASSLFVMGLGMGIPLLLLGMSMGKLLPKAGIWMEKIKQLFGVLMLGIAIYLLERILDEQVVLFLWASLLILSTGAMGLFKPLTDKAKAIDGVIKSLGWLVFAYGILLFLLVLKGGGDVFSPLSGWANNSYSVVQKPVFHLVDNKYELNQLLKKAENDGQLSMLDFYADWCVNCKYIEKLFIKPEVAKALSKIVMIKADVTKNTEQQQALMKAYGIIGPPALLFFKQSSELRGMRIIGETNQEALLKRLSL